MYFSAERNGNKVLVWERHDPDTRIMKEYTTPHEFFIEDPNGAHTSIYGHKLTKLTFKSFWEMRNTAEDLKARGVKLFEYDVDSVVKVLSSNYYGTEVPIPNISFWDIEVDYEPGRGFANFDNPYAPLNSVAIHHYWNNRTVLYAVPPSTWGDESTWEEQLDKSLLDISEINLVKSEKEILLAILREIRDTDILVGYNSEFFDTPYLYKRIEMVLGPEFLKDLSFPNANPVRTSIRENYGREETVIQSSSRIYSDYLLLLRKFELEERHSYSLENVSEDLLDLPKLNYEGTLAELYKNNFNYFMRYNIRDTECLKGFEDGQGFVQLAVSMYHSDTGLYRHVLGTVALVEMAIMNELHHEMGGLRVPDTEPPMDLGGAKADGALVLTPKSGMHHNIGSADINSLYPSAIQAIDISPENLVGHFPLGEEVSTNIHNPEMQNIEVMCLMEDKLSGTTSSVRKTYGEWKDYIISNKFALSGSGTLFDQKHRGIIPRILDKWFATRRMYQAKMRKCRTLLVELEKELGSEFEAMKDHPEIKKIIEDEVYYDRRQLIFKLKLNSAYGALLNKFFKFYDERLGESTTGTGRAILRFMGSTINEYQGGEFSYLGDRIIYGDTDSIYFLLNSEELDEQIEEADRVAEFVNGKFPQFMEDRFFCQPDYATLIKASREYVAKSGIFVTPKRYALHVLNDEGKPKDEIYITGLDMIKTTLPKFYQEYTKGILERYMRGEKWIDISRDIVDFKTQVLEDKSIELVGLPMGIKNIETYQRDFENSGDPKFRLPGHVAAAILYNQSLKAYNDMDSAPISTGDKMNSYILKKPVIGQHGKAFTRIALPVDIQKVPDWFMENYFDNIDFDAQLYRLIDKPLDNTLKVVGAVMATPHFVLANDIFEIG